MSHKTMRAQIILFGFILLVSPALAMDTQKAESALTQYVLSKGGVHLPPLDFPTPLKAKFLIAAPQGMHAEADLEAYSNAQRPVVLAKLIKVLQLYLNQLDTDLYGENSERPIAGIQPTHVFFSPDTNMLSVIQKWGTHTVSKGVTLNLKTRIDCKFDLDKGTFTPGPRIIHMQQKTPTAKKLAATMEMLLERFPQKKLAGSNHDAMQELLAKLDTMRSEREAGLAAEKDPNTLPNHIAAMNAFVLEDLKKLADFYWQQHFIEDIE